MDKVSIVKREIQAAEWAERIKACQTSGQTVTKWCEENGIAPKTYYYHLRKIREKVCEQIPIPVGRLSENHGGIRITTSGLTVEITDGTSAEAIEAVIRAIQC